MYAASDLFDFAQTDHAAVFEGATYAWDALKRLPDYIESAVRPGVGVPPPSPRIFIGPKVQIGEGAVIEDGAFIKGPAIIGRRAHIRHNAYIREFVIVGDDCVVGNSTEVKNALLFNGVQVPHFNYVGDSILGHKAHLGAGVILSNVRLDHGNIWIDVDGTPTDTGLRKFGAMVGDGAEIGCNAVINPGSILGRNSMVYPGLCWRGVLPANMIAKNPVEPAVVPRRPKYA
jgi:UDP-N-acetylglucosamine diphosphorylase / glucose-1-phosphate thymidylyltransferase / UDP-N-acetylgalactosamine diphosphorylase / glucosamine-1-phosphate N-acetyltransferase / galactosamine-1-phosphate N-acetyltransferase